MVWVAREIDAECAGLEHDRPQVSVGWQRLDRKNARSIRQERSLLAGCSIKQRPRHRRNMREIAESLTRTAGIEVPSPYQVPCDFADLTGGVPRRRIGFRLIHRYKHKQPSGGKETRNSGKKRTHFFSPLWIRIHQSQLFSVRKS